MKCGRFPPEVPLAVRLVFLGHRVAHLIERRLARHDYTHTQAAIIMVLGRRPGLTAQDLTGPVHVEPASITRALQALERRGLVDRQPHPTDGRASLLQLTAAGREAEATIARVVRETSAALEDELAPEQVHAFHTALESVLARVERLRGAEQ